jgi:hypothetical protein
MKVNQPFQVFATQKLFSQRREEHSVRAISGRSLV